MTKPLKWWLLLYLAMISPYFKTYLLNLLFRLLDSKEVWYLLPTYFSIFIIYVNYGIGIRVWGCLRLPRDCISFYLSLSLSLHPPPPLNLFPFCDCFVAVVDESVLRALKKGNGMRRKCDTLTRDPRLRRDPGTVYSELLPLRTGGGFKVCVCTPSFFV